MGWKIKYKYISILQKQKLDVAYIKATLTRLYYSKVNHVDHNYTIVFDHWIKQIHQGLTAYLDLHLDNASKCWEIAKIYDNRNALLVELFVLLLIQIQL
jgi:hypothetical protein